VVYQDRLTSPKQVADIVKKFRNITQAEGFRTTLTPGDTLYIPPFWFTQAHFDQPSIFLKSFSSIYESDVLDELLRVATPHIDHIDTEVAAIKRAIDRIITEGLGLDPSFFISRLLESRYLPLYGHLEVSTSTDFAPCFELDPENEKHVLGFLDNYLTQMTTTIKALDALGPVKELVVEEFLEHLVHKTLSAEDAYNFYANCFSTGVSNSKSTAQDIE